MYALAYYVIQPISLFIISQEPRSTFLKVSYNYDFIFIAFLLFSLHFQPKNNLSSLRPPFWCLLNRPESFCSVLKLFIHLNLYKWLLMITLSFFLVLWLFYLPVPTNNFFFCSKILFETLCCLLHMTNPSQHLPHVFFTVYVSCLI